MEESADGREPGDQHAGWAERENTFDWLCCCEAWEIYCVFSILKQVAEQFVQKLGRFTSISLSQQIFWRDRLNSHPGGSIGSGEKRMWFSWTL